MKPALLDVEDLTVVYDGDDGSRVDLVAGVSFVLRAGETLGLVGESGSGKSLTALAMMDLLGPNLAAGGTITLENRREGGLALRAAGGPRQSPHTTMGQTPRAAADLADRCCNRIRRPT